MEGLFEKTRDFNSDIVRNIVSLRDSQNLFDDLVEAGDETDVLVAAEMRIKSEAEPGVISRGFYYSTAIEYPFKTEPFMVSRYGNGSYPVWYGSLHVDTTIYETGWHMYNELSGIDGLNEPVTRERAVYNVGCRALLFDLVDKKEDFPELVASHYELTHQVGKRIQSEGHPGLVTASARHNNGINTVIFKQDVLDNPRLSYYLNYHYEPVNKTLVIEREPGKRYLEIKYQEV